MIPNQVFEQLACGAFDKAQAIIVMKMLLVTAENVRAQVRAEFAQELSAMRADYGRLIIEAVEATEAKIFARLEQEAKAAEEKKRVRREAAAARKREREAASAAAPIANQTGLFDGVIEDPALMDGGQAGLVQEAGLPRMKAGLDERPATGGIAAKFEDNPEFKALMEQWERQAAEGKRQRPIGSPMAAVADLGQAILASLEREEREEREKEAQQAVRHEVANGDESQEALMIEYAPDEQQVEPVADVMLQAAE